MSYKHGAYGEIIEGTQQIENLNYGTIPFYIGTAPVQRVRKISNSINKPIIIGDLEEAKEKLGYSDFDDWKEYSLSEVISAHFKNRIKAIGPIVVVNVLNPSEHFKQDKEKVILTNKIGYISKSAILESITIENCKINEDFKVEYTIEGKVKITALTEKVASPVECNFNVVDVSKITEKDIIGGYDPDTDERTGLNNIQICYEELGIVPSVLSAPGWNHIPVVEKALINNSTNIGGHWSAICVTDLDPTCKNIEEAREWKVKNNYVNDNEKTVWPKAEIQGKEMWLSIITIVRMQQTDYKNKGIPYESPSNKEIDISGLIINGSKKKFNQVQGNKLNEKGITTAIYNGGKWVLWGPHMANYEYTITQDDFSKIFDVNIRTNIYLLNDFQLRNARLIDSPIARKDIDSILNTEQIRLDSLKADGKILFGNISFLAKENSINDLVQGDFVFNTEVTNTPPGKSLINRIQYTTKGINSLLGEDK